MDMAFPPVENSGNDFKPLLIDYRECPKSVNCQGIFYNSRAKERRTVLGPGMYSGAFLRKPFW